MIMVGKNLTSSDDSLVKTTIQYLVNAIKSPKREIETSIRHLRGVYSINPKQYSVLKRQLPYFVCGSFNPPYRRKDNFAFTQHFIIDIDKLNSKSLDPDTVRIGIQADPQVLVCFKSPSEDGIKVMFRLKERCYDPARYSVCYKMFMRDFSHRHNLDQVIDEVTSDVSRACFISIDPDIYYNAEAEPVDFEALVASDDLNAFMEAERSIAAVNAKPKAADGNAKPGPAEPSDEILDQIRAKLNPKAIVPAKREPAVPSILNDIIDGLEQYIKSFGIDVRETKNIQYGKKLICAVGIKLGEINLYYGKRGFSTIKSPKAGTNDEFNDVLCDIIRQYISNL